MINTPPKREFLERKKTESEDLRDTERERERRGSTKQNATPRQWKMHQSKHCGVQKRDQRFSLYALCARRTAIGHHYEGLRRRRPYRPREPRRAPCIVASRYLPSTHNVPIPNYPLLIH
jgi:hypothetical protein